MSLEQKLDEALETSETGITYILSIEDEDLPYYLRKNKKNLGLLEVHDAAISMFSSGVEQQETGDVLSDVDIWDYSDQIDASLTMMYDGSPLAWLTLNLDGVDNISFSEFSVSRKHDVLNNILTRGLIDDLSKVSYHGRMHNTWDVLIKNLGVIEKKFLNSLGQS